MAGLVPAIHVAAFVVRNMVSSYAFLSVSNGKGSVRMDGRDKPGHDAAFVVGRKFERRYP